MKVREEEEEEEVIIMRDGVLRTKSKSKSRGC